MRPNRPAPGSAPAPAYTQPISLSEMSRKLDVQDAPLTKASQIPGGFNPASAAPVQVEGSGMTPANNYVPSSVTPALQLSQEQIAQKFGNDMVNVYGREKANSIMSSPSAQGIYLHYINNGYQLPAL